MKINNVLKEIEDITFKLIHSGICDEYNIGIRNGNKVEWQGFDDLSIVLKDQPYEKIYNLLRNKHNYNFRLLDGGLIQLLYQFENNILKSHRLAYYPAPDFEVYQNDPDRYLYDEIYGDIVNKQVLPVVVRIDYNKNMINSDIHHPYVHITLGGYKNCRIPALKPFSPKKFMEFILEHFYFKSNDNFVEPFLEKVKIVHDHIYEKDLLKTYMS